jgi:hypothetical protein
MILKLQFISTVFTICVSVDKEVNKLQTSSTEASVIWLVGAALTPRAHAVKINDKFINWFFIIILNKFFDKR